MAAKTMRVQEADPSNTKPTIFLCCAKADAKWRDALTEQLAPMLRNAQFDVWDETRILPGETRQQSIEAALNRADVGVLLVTPAFLASDTIFQKQLPTLLNKKVLWVAVRASNYKATQIEAYQALNDPSHPLAGLSASKRDTEWVSICEKISGALATQPEDADVLTGVRWANARNKYFDYLKSQCEHINPRGIALNENAVTLPLDAVYVSLRAEQKAILYLEPAFLEANFVAVGSLSIMEGSIMEGADVAKALAETQLNERGAQSGRINVGSPTSELIQRGGRLNRQAEVVTRKMELYEVVQRERLAVLLGAPGAGKTTLTRFVTARFAEACRDNMPQVTDKSGNRYGETRLPILLRVATYAEALDKDHTLSLRQFLSQPFHDTGIPDAERAAFFEAALEQGKALMLLDGLDEVASGADRAHIARQIESFVSGLDARCRVLVTSRIVGYREARLGGAFAEYEMLDMDDAQMREFLNRWCVEVERFQTPNADKAEIERKGREESGRLQQAITRSEGVRKLATNPLLLTILALIHRNQKHLPERRVELYRMASDTLLREWRPAQTGIKGVEVTEAEAETLLQPLAYEMHNTVETGLLDREAVRKLLCRVACRRKTPP